jgi:hypothetical protein
MNYRPYRRILTIVLLMSFWKMPLSGEPWTAQTRNSEESGMRQYSELEVDTLIEELTGAAHEAIEKAASLAARRVLEAAKAAALASLDREMAALSEAQRLQRKNSRLKQSRVKTAVVTGVICFFGGLALGAGGIAILTGR